MIIVAKKGEEELFDVLKALPVNTPHSSDAPNCINPSKTHDGMAKSSFFEPLKLFIFFLLLL